MISGTKPGKKKKKKKKEEAVQEGGGRKAETFEKSVF